VLPLELVNRIILYVAEFRAVDQSELLKSVQRTVYLVSTKHLDYIYHSAIRLLDIRRISEHNIVQAHKGLPPSWYPQINLPRLANDAERLSVAPKRFRNRAGH